MSTVFSSINTGLTALRAFQAAQNVTGGNISNVSTKGYTRREVVLTPSSNGGVDVACVRRICDRFAQNALRSAAGESSREGAVRDALVSAENAVNPLSEGSVFASLGSLWETLQDLSSNPSDTGVRRNAVASAQSLASSVNTLTDTLNGLQLDLGGKAANAVDTVNGLLGRISDLNTKIQQAESSGEFANALRDSRDSALDELSGCMDIDVAENETGVVVSCQGRTLLYGDNCRTVTASLEGKDSKELKFTLGAGGDEISVSGGSLAGYREAVSELQTLRDGVAGVKSALVSKAAGSLNAMHAAGYTLAGNVSMQALFSQDSAGELQVNPLISKDPSLLAASAGGNEGDGDNASAMASALKNGWNGGDSLETTVAALSTELGSRVAVAKGRANNADALKESAQNSFDSVSGVSLDEESARLIELQNSYAAAAKYITSVNTTMDYLLSILG